MVRRRRFGATGSYLLNLLFGLYLELFMCGMAVRGCYGVGRLVGMCRQSSATARILFHALIGQIKAIKREG